MPINPDSRMRKTRKAYHGWNDGYQYFLSVQPRQNKGPFNTYVTAQEALIEASRRGLPIIWDDPSVIS